MDNAKTAYRIKVTTTSGNVYLICVSYPLDSRPSNYGLDFYELSWPTGLETHSIPSHRQATFAEELLASHRASCTRHTNEGAEEQFIVKKVRSVYGDNAAVSMSVIDQSMSTYDF